MSATQNDETAGAVSGQGEFSSRVAPSEPTMTGGHQPGRETGPPVHHIETLPAGTAPPDKTFAPQNESDIPGQALNPDATATTGANDFPGATSADVHTGYGHPGQGQSSKELHHDGQGHRERQAVGLTGRGAAVGGFDQETNDGKRAKVPGVDE